MTLRDQNSIYAYLNCKLHLRQPYIAYLNAFRGRGDRVHDGASELLKVITRRTEIRVVE